MPKNTPGDTHIVETVEEWDRRQAELRQEEIRLKHARAVKRWEDFKVGLLWVAAVVFFPITAFIQFYKWSEDSDDARATFWLISFLCFAATVAGSVCALRPHVPTAQESFATCVATWDKESCLTLLLACPVRREQVAQQCIDKCPCAEGGEKPCKAHDAACFDGCLKSDAYDLQDTVFAECAQKMEFATCKAVFDHCGNF